LKCPEELSPSGRETGRETGDGCTSSIIRYFLRETYGRLSEFLIRMVEALGKINHRKIGCPY